jgi:hypothetical protein
MSGDTTLFQSTPEDEHFAFHVQGFGLRVSGAASGFQVSGFWFGG